MRIVYSLAGEGLGHIIRTTKIVEEMCSRGHKILILTGESSEQGARDLACRFENVSFYKIPVPRFVFKKERFSFIGTLGHFINYAKKMISIKKELRNIISAFDPDIAISDYEPSLSRIVRPMGIPVVSACSQNYFTFGNISYLPIKYRIIARGIGIFNRFFLGPCDCFIVMRGFGQNAKNILFSGPLVDTDMVRHPVEKSVVIYGSESVSKKYQKVVSKLVQLGYKVIVYGIPSFQETPGVIKKKTSRKTFVDDLSRCAGLVANSGYTLINEATHLKIPSLFVAPSGLIEQEINLIEARRNGFIGVHYKDLNDLNVIDLDFRIKNGIFIKSVHSADVGEITNFIENAKNDSVRDS
jgi:uncharacterized protein (TIGR00661 family)